MPRMTEDEIAAFLDEPGHLVRIGTIDSDGYPSVVPTWFIHRDGLILFTPRGPAAFLANLRRDPRIGLSVDEDPLPYRKVTVRGSARIVHEPGDDDIWREWSARGVARARDFTWDRCAAAHAEVFRSVAARTA